MFRRLLLLPLLATLLAIGHKTTAQPMYFKTGTGTSGNTIPLNQSSQKTQLLYAPGDFQTLPASGGISKIYFRNSAAAATGTFTNFQVSFLQNSATAFSGTSFFTGLTPALTAATFTVTGSASAGGWFEIPLPAPYYAYDSTQTLIVEIQYSAKTGGLSTTTSSSTGNKRCSGTSLTATTGTTNTTWNDFGIDVVPLGNCTDPPAQATTGASLQSTVCPGTPVYLSLSGGTLGVGQTYIWESAPQVAGNPGTFTPLGTSTSDNFLNTTVPATRYYRAQVTCGSGTTASVPVLVTVNPGLAGGTYTINSALPSSATNFQTIGAAVNAMSSCGILGPVVFNVNVGTGIGTYNEQVIIPQIAGASATNTITFNGNGDTIRYYAGVSSQRAVVKLDGADHVTLNNFVIDASGGTSYGYGVQLLSNADSNTINGCTILSSLTSTSNSAYVGLVISGGATSITSAGDCDATTISGNTIIGGYHGIAAIGDDLTAPLLNTKIIGNIIQDYHANGIDIDGHLGLLVEGNDISRPTRTVTATTTYGIYVITTDNSRISKNRIHNPMGAMPTGTPTVYGILITGADASASTPNIISNNVVYNFTAGANQFGIANTSSDNAHYFHNTISLDHSAFNAGSTSTTTRGFNQTTAATGVRFMNNIVHVTRGGTGVKHAIYLATTTSTVESDNNVLYVSSAAGTNNIGYANSTQHPTLPDWHASTQDSNSVSTDPLFTVAGTGNFLPTAAAVGNIGTAVGILTDILNNPRAVVNPDPGAYEIGTPQCPAPTNLAAANVTVSTADLSWTAVAGATGFQYAVTTSATPPASGTPTTANTFNATGLPSATVHYLHVRMECGAGNFSPWSTVTFTTGCASLSAIITPAGPTTFCAGGSVVLNASTGTGYTYQWKEGGNNIPGATGSSYTATTAGSYTVEVSSGPTCSANSTITAVTVNSLPPNNVASPGTSFCAGSSLAMAGPAGTGLTYQWYDGTTLISGATNQTYSATAAGTYTVVVSNANCSDTSAPIVLTVNSPLIASTTPGSRCDTGAVTLSATGSTGTSIEWFTTATGGTSIGSGSPFVTPSIPATTTYYAAAVTSGGSAALGPLNPAAVSSSGSGNAATPQYLIFDVTQATATIISVDVFPTTAIGTTNSIEIRNSTGSTLLNTIPFTVTATSTGGTVAQTIPMNVTLPQGTGYRMKLATSAGAELYRNTSGAVYPYTSSSISITGQSFSAGYYYWFYNWQVSSNCESPRVPVIATVNPLPPAVATASSTTTVCQGETVSINGNAGSTYTYQWQENGSDISGATNPTYVANTTGSYAVVVSDGLCTDTSAAVIVNVNPTPTATLTPSGPVEFCDGGNVPVNGPTGPGYNYAWLQSGTPIQGATGPSYVITASGNYSLVLTENNCSDTSAVIVATENPLPAPTINVSGNVLSTTGSYTSYQWNFNGGPITGATAQTHTAAQTGAYTVTVTDTNGCTGTSTISNVVVTSVGKNVIAGTPVRIYPNPASRMVYIEADQPVDVRVMSVDGKLLLQQKRTQSVDISSLAAGMYTIKVYDVAGNMLRIEKLVKMD